VASYSTPVIVRVNGRDQIINNMPTRVVAYDLDDGEILWTVAGIPGKQDLVYTSPLIAGELGITMAGFRGPRLGYRLNGSGDVTTTHRHWHIEKRNPQRIGTGVVVNGCVYTANVGPGTIECIDAKTGESQWQKRTPGGDAWASIVFGAGHLYVTAQRGTTHVIRPNPEELEVIESNSLGETTNATPAISEGQIFIRSFSHLFCIE
jgi:outer membrane protein assembly factor BamB